MHSTYNPSRLSRWITIRGPWPTKSTVQSTGYGTREPGPASVLFYQVHSGKQGGAWIRRQGEANSEQRAGGTGDGGLGTQGHADETTSHHGHSGDAARQRHRFAASPASRPASP